jgi:hypothetical protein
LFERPKTSYTSHCKSIKRIFWLIGICDVDWNIAHACDLVPSTQKLHSICALNQYDVTKLMVRELACFCCFYMERQWFACSYLQWTNEWRPKTLKLVDTNFVWSIMEKEDVN